MRGCSGSVGVELGRRLMGEAVVVHNVPLVGGMGHLADIVVHPRRKGQAAVCHRREFAVAIDHHADGRGCRMGQRKAGAHRAGAHIQLPGHRLPAGLFNQSRHSRRGQHRQFPAAQRLGGIFGGNTQGRVPLDSRFQHLYDPLFPGFFIKCIIPGRGTDCKIPPFSPTALRFAAKPAILGS